MTGLGRVGSVVGAARKEARISSGEGMVGREILLPGFVVLHETPSRLFLPVP